MVDYQQKWTYINHITIHLWHVQGLEGKWFTITLESLFDVRMPRTFRDVNLIYSRCALRWEAHLKLEDYTDTPPWQTDCHELPICFIPIYDLIQGPPFITRVMGIAKMDPKQKHHHYYRQSVHYKTYAYGSFALCRVCCGMVLVDFTHNIQICWTRIDWSMQVNDPEDCK